MMELSFFLRMCIFFFAVIGFLRGVYREFVGLAGILLGIFLLFEYGWVLDLFIGGTSPGTRFAIEAGLFVALVFFAYEQAPTSFAPRAYRTSAGRVRIPDDKNWQTRTLGAVFGGLNGYLVVGSLWYIMDQFEYPLDSLFVQPAVGSASADFVSNLPLVFLHGNLLIALIMGLFLLIIIFR